MNTEQENLIYKYESTRAALASTLSEAQKVLLDAMSVYLSDFVTSVLKSAKDYTKSDFKKLLYSQNKELFTDEYIDFIEKALGNKDE